MTVIPVIGGGVAGLVAAAQLAEQGLQPLVLEADPERVGGRLKGGPAVELAHAGQRWRFPSEHGIHGIWSGYVNFKALLAHHGLLPDLLPARQETWVLVSGRRVRRSNIGGGLRSSLIPAPFHYFGLLFNPRFLSMLSPRDWLVLPRLMGSFLAAMSIDPLREQKSLKGMSLVDFTAGWSPRMRGFFAGLARNALAAHPEDIPASGFIAFLRFYTLMRRDAWAFSYLPGSGGECVSEPLAALVGRLGGRVELGCRVVRLDRQDGRWLISYQRQGLAEQQELVADQLVMALDSPAAQRLLGASPDIAGELSRLSFPTGVPTAIFRLWFSARPRRSAEAGIFSGDSSLDNFFWMDRILPAYREWAAATGGSALEGHIYGPPELLAQPDALLLAQVQTDLLKVFPELRDSLLHALVQRNLATHTLFGVGDPGEYLAVESPWPGLYACGDWISHPSPALYLERATVTGMAAANAVLKRLGLPPWPILPAPAPEWLAGKIEGLLWRHRQRLLKQKRRRQGPG